MSDPRFTPGPWAVKMWPDRCYVVPAAHMGRKIGGASDPIVDRDEYAQEVAQIDRKHRHRPDYEQEATARLIAAAPDLYAALEWIARDAIYKAPEQMNEVSRKYAMKAAAALAKVQS